MDEKIFAFPVAPRLTRKGNKYPNFLKMESLNGRRPYGHPAILRDLKGKIVLGPKQVWVEMGTNELWVIYFLRKLSNGRFVVSIKPYGHSEVSRSLLESTLRQCFRIWENQVEFQKKLYRDFPEKLGEYLDTNAIHELEVKKPDAEKEIPPKEVLPKLRATWMDILKPK